jgi:hypothetical protein
MAVQREEDRTEEVDEDNTVRMEEIKRAIIFAGIHEWVFRRDNNISLTPM